MIEKLKLLLLGKPLATDRDDEGHLLGKTQALAMLSSDALSSIAYGPQQVILVLTAVSSAAIWWSLPIGLIVLLLLASLTISYQQVIHAYPQGGGAYVVTTENLNPSLGLIAGGSLLIDYMLTVAVSVSSGADAITSAFPALAPWNLGIAIFLTLLLMYLNLRGVSESAKSLMVPVYFFIGAILFMIGFGFFKIATGQIPYQATAHIGAVVPNVSIILLLRAFTSGSASLTGVEAISNSVPFFKKPKEKNAAKTLGIMSLLLALMFSGITFLNYYMGLVPTANVTTLAQIAKGIFGQSPLGNAFFYVFQLSTALILAVAANTGFSAFPMLSFNMAKNKFMPHLFMEKGQRLGYSNGIIALALGSLILLLIFEGSTEALIPLYTIGVFVPFALSQTGMIVHWKRTIGRGFLRKSIANIIGASICYMIVAILLVTRIGDIWPFFPIVGVLMAVFYSIKRHYDNVASQLRLTDEVKNIAYTGGNTVLVLVGNVTQASIRAINYATSIGDQVIAMHVSTKETQHKDHEVEREFREYFPTINFQNIQSSYNDIVKPTVAYVQAMSDKAQAENATMTVVIPKFVPNKRWQNILHNQMSVRIRLSLRWNENIVIASYSYHLKK